MDRTIINVVGNSMTPPLMPSGKVNSEKLSVTKQKIFHQSSKQYPRWLDPKLIVRIYNQLCLSRYHRVPGVIPVRPFLFKFGMGF
jgi:hypothetical protein